MAKTYEIMRYEQAAALMGAKWQRLALKLPEEQQSRAEEFRLRAGKPMTVLLPEGEIPVSDDGQSVSPQDLEQLCDIVTSYSRYASGETMSQGYLIARGGFRVGLCGTAVMRQEKNSNLRELSSAVIRIGREFPGSAKPLLPELLRDGSFINTILLAPPGAGKTTLLRDLVRTLSDGTPYLPPQRVALVDERGELAAAVHGVPQLNVGAHTDILNGCPKALGIPMLLRGMNPQIIAVDEITARDDIYAMAQAANCGVKLLATIHAASVEELKGKGLFLKLLRLHMFEKAVVIRCSPQGRTYRVEDIAW